MKAIVRKRQQRRLVEDKGDLKFTVRGTAVETQKIQRWMKRNEVPESFLYVPSPAACKSLSFVHTLVTKLTSASHPIRCGISDNLRNRFSHVTSVVLSSIPLLFTRNTQEYSSNSCIHGLSSSALSIASLVWHQGSSFAGQSPAPIHRTLPSDNTLAVPFLPRELIPPFTAQPATGISDIRYRETEELQARWELTMIEETYGIHDQRTLPYSSKLSDILRAQGRFRAAETMARRHLEALRKQEDCDELRIQEAFQLLGKVLADQGLYAEAGRLFKRAFEFWKRMFGADHMITLSNMSSLASTYMLQGFTKEAVELGSQGVDIQIRVFGERDPETLTSMRNLALIYIRDGQLQEAEGLMLQVIKGRNSVLGPIHVDTLTSIGLLASLHVRQERFEEAAEALENTTRILKEVLGEWHPDTLIHMVSLAHAWKGLGHRARAISTMEACFEMQKKVMGPQHPDTLSALSSLRLWGTYM